MAHRSIAETFNQKFCAAIGGSGVQSFQQLLPVTSSAIGVLGGLQPFLLAAWDLGSFKMCAHWMRTGLSGLLLLRQGLSVGLPFGKSNVTPMATGLW